MSLMEKPPLDELMHYGTKRHSGRYPWGSGEDPYQHSGDFVSRVQELRKSGVKDNEIAEHFGLTLENFRTEYRLANHERKYEQYQQAKSLRDKGYSNYKIGEMMGGLNESTVRSILNEHTAAKLTESKETADFLKEQIKEKKIIDIGKGVERELGISRGRLDEAIYSLKMEGYTTYKRYIDQTVNPGQKTTIEILCEPDTKYEDIKDVTHEIKSITEYKSQDDGKSFQPKFVYPKSLDSSRVYVRYTEDGGSERDGIIELRRGVDDISLGNDRYAQVRILVDNKKYLKGVAVYSDDIPDGYDVVFNTNKTKDVDKMDVFKKIKENNENPFGTNIKPMEEGGQRYYIDANGKKQLSVINKKSSEGDWSEWSNNLPSQFLSKQPLELAQRQLKLAIDEHEANYKEIKGYTNPTVKKKLLMDFAEGCDSAAVHLKAAALPRQQHHLLIPINSLKDNEIYAPNYPDGTEVALVRYPHGGTFEIPILTVNNKNRDGKRLLGNNVPDAVGINANVAARLSGADFDGDTAMVIPNPKKHNIKSTKSLRGLEGFDPKLEYSTTEKNGKRYNRFGDEVKIMGEAQKQNEMGRITNLIADMTLQGASDDELARAVRHSMVVIDAEKHKLDYKQSEVENNIKGLKDKYQGKVNPKTGRTTHGAATIITRAKSQEPVAKTQGQYKINIKGKEWYDPTRPEGAKLYKTSSKAHFPEPAVDKKNPNLKGYTLLDGKKVFFDPNDPKQLDYYRPVRIEDKKTGEVYFTNKTGDLTYRTKLRTKQSTKMAETDDAYTLVSKENWPMERLYANYANKMKAMANDARKEYYTTKGTVYSPSANKAYENEVNSLKHKLNEALKNSPRERRANLIANLDVEAKKQSNPGMDKDDIAKAKQQALERARESVGAKRHTIIITDREWSAIQSGAITNKLLEDILKYADMDVVKSKAMPRNNKSLTTAQISSLKTKYESGSYTTAQLADIYGVSPGTIKSILYGKE